MLLQRKGMWRAEGVTLRAGLQSALIDRSAESPVLPRRELSPTGGTSCPLSSRQSGLRAARNPNVEARRRNVAQSHLQKAEVPEALRPAGHRRARPPPLLAVTSPLWGYFTPSVPQICKENSVAKLSRNQTKDFGAVEKQLPKTGLRWERESRQESAVCFNFVTFVFILECF